MSLTALRHVLDYALFFGGLGVFLVGALALWLPYRRGDQ